MLATTFLLTACGNNEVEPSATPEPQSTEIPDVTETPTAEPTVAPTSTPEPTATPEPQPVKGEMQVFKQSDETIAKNEALWANRPFTPRQMEQLNRGLVAVNTDSGVFVSWRWLGEESNTVKYNLYRDGKRVNAFALNVTNYTDTNGTVDSAYQVAAVVDGIEQEKCDAVKVWEDNSYEIALNKPAPYEKRGKNAGVGEYAPNDASVADLDGDGELEIVVKWYPNDAKDNSQEGLTSPTILDAYELDGTQMWRIDLGPNIRSGAHYTQYMVYDLDGDGKAEIVCKTADATIDGAGNSVGDPEGYYARATGRILTGPEYLTVFDGETGTIIDTIPYEVERGKVAAWGDDYGNRCDRFLACVAYLDGSTPSVIMCRGYYTRAYLAAYNLVDEKLQKVWHFDSNEEGNKAAAGQGNHSVTVADIDMDGKDEIIYGAAAIDDNGTLMYSTGLGHGDAQHTGDLIPERPGLEIFSVHESGGADFGLEMRDAMTGDILWGSYEATDVGRGVSADIDPAFPGSESWASGKLIASTGQLISTNPGISSNFRIYWDGDLGDEIQDNNRIDEWAPDQNATTPILNAKGYVSCNGTKATPGITCDLIGDWREETILYAEDGNSMAIFISTIPTDYKIYTLMHDLQYRTYIATQNVAYNQPPHTGYYLGFDTTEIPVPRVSWKNGDTVVTNPDLANGTKFYPIETLMRENNVTLAVDSLHAIVNDSMQRVDSEFNVVAPYESNGEIYVPVSFISEAFGVDASLSEGICLMKTTTGETVTAIAPGETKEGLHCVPISVVTALGKVITLGEGGLVHIADAEVTMDAETCNILANIIDTYVEPEDTGDQPITAELIAENQIPVMAVKATNHDGNIPEGAVDGDFSTRWNGWDDGATLTVDLGETKKIASIAAAFYLSDERNYFFDIEVSNDGETWTRVLEAQSSPIIKEKDLANFPFPETVEARYLRYVGHNSSANNANNIWELVILAP